jgi:hypothetical protein
VPAAEGAGAGAAAGDKGLATRLAARAALLALWPVKTMADSWALCAPASVLLLPAAALHATLLLTGPWLFARISSSDAAPGLVFPWGVLRRPATLAGGRPPFEFYACADPTIGGGLWAWMVLVPLTLWLGWASTALTGAAAAAAAAAAHEEEDGAWPLSPSRRRLATAAAAAMTALPAALLHLKFVVRMGATYGLLAAALSPVMGLPLVLLALWWLRTAAVEARRGAAAKAAEQARRR